MAWRFSDAPDQIGKEVGENLADGDYEASNPDWSYAGGVWSRDGGGTLVLADGDPFTAYTFEPDSTYTLAAEVLADTEATIGWGMSLESNGEQVVIGDAGVDVGETVPGGEWVTVSKEWRSPDGGAVGSVAFYASAPGVVQVRNVSVAEQTGRVVLTVPGDVLAETIMASGGIVAGTPGGARVELTEDGLLAFDAAGTETARIQGDGGEFVGGEFRTSDNLPGQVRLADDAYVTHLDGGGVFPGLRITPADASDFSHLPAIGPGEHGLTIYGGRRTGGGSSIVQCNPTESFMRTFHGGGGTAGEIQTSPAASYMRTYREDSTAAGEIQTSPAASYMRTYREDGEIGGSIQASPAKAFMQTYGDPAVGRSYSQVDPQRATMNVVGADGLNTARITADGNSVTLFSATNGQRYLKLDDTGIWIETGGKSYNLEETAQDSGWNSFPVKGGITASSDLAWRNKNGVIYFRGTVDTNWVGGQYTEVVTGLPAEMRPKSDMIALSPDSTNVPMVIMMTASGTIRVWKSTSGSRGTWMSMLSYPLG